MTLFHRRIIVLSLVFGLVGIAGMGPSLGQGQNLQKFEKSSLSIETKTGLHKFRVEIARRPKQHAQGLMFRRRMPIDAGMLFLYRYAEPARMWMKNTYIPLDLLYIDGMGKIVGFHQRAVPQSLEVMSSKKPVNAVLELNAGTVGRLQIEVGDKIIHPAFRTK